VPPLPRLHTPCISDLYEQLRYAPRDAILRDIERAEALADEIDAGVAYPEDWIVFRVTGYRPNISAPAIVQGEALLADLSSLVERLSESIAGKARAGRSTPTADDLLNIDTLQARWSVSRKTIDRYRKRGLVARRVRDEGGRTILVFSQRVVEAFERRSADVLEDAGAFTRMTDEEATRLLHRARRYKDAGLSLNEAALRLSRRCGRSHEAVRQLLRRHDRASKQPIFGHLSRPADKRKAIALRAARLGITPSEMARKYDRSRGSVTRMLIEARAERLARYTLAQGQIDEASLQRSEAQADLAPPPAEDLLDLLERARSLPPPSAPLERALAAARTALERKAGALISSLAPNPTARAVDETETLLRWESRIRAVLVDQQLGVVLRTIEDRLAQQVDRIPGRHLAELVVLAIDATARGVQAFDPARGGRLAAPVGLSVSRAVAQWLRSHPSFAAQPGVLGRATARPTRGRSAGHWSMRVSPWQADLEADPRVRRRAAALDEPWRTLIIARYALGGERPLTTAEAAERLRVSPSRVVAMERQGIRLALRIPELAPES